jgi:hypothetical protein
MGPAGPEGPAGATGYAWDLEESAWDSSDQKFETASCPTGKVVVGGGGKIVGTISSFENPAVTESFPDPIAGSWKAEAEERGLGTFGDWALQVWAICVDAS